MTGGDDSRYERKFEVETFDAAGVRSVLLRHPAMFRPTYPPRWVNNVYLDSPGLEAYLDNVEGNPQRAKARIRWYGAFRGPVTGAVLELKSKSGLAGSKDRHPLPPFVMDDRVTGRRLAVMIRDLPDLDAPTRHLAARLGEATANRYHREYYLSSDGRFRVTIDHRLTFATVGRLWGGVRPAPAARPVVVVEVKYAPEADPDADRMCEAFPFRVARHSKYARGVEAALGSA